MSFAAMDWSYVFDPRRWRSRFRTEEAVRDEALTEGHAPDASVDEVGEAPPKAGFDGHALEDDQGSGYGTGTVGGPGWAGWS